jgi:hypothetical protein
MGRSEGRIVRRKIQVRCGSEGGTPPHELPESQGEEDVGILHAHPQSGKVQEDLPNHGQHPIRCPVRSPASELGAAHSRDSRTGHPQHRPETLLPFPLPPAPLAPSCTNASRRMRRTC